MVAVGDTSPISNLAIIGRLGLLAHLKQVRRCGSLRSMSTPTEIDPKELRPRLHAEIDKLKDEDLAAAHRALLEIEMQRLLSEMDEATERAWASGEITKEKIAEAILEHRRKNPHG